MKILFTADLHIKLGQKNVPVDWQRNRFRLFFSELSRLIEQEAIDILILGGDLFDRAAPSMPELEIYFELLACMRKDLKVIIYSGNHESVKKNTTSLSNLKLATSSILPNAIIIDDFYSYENIDFIPYNKLREYYPQDIDFTGNILCTHVRGSIPPHVKPEVPLELFSRWELVLAGDLHSYSNSQLNILYPGSPMSTSFHRSEVTSGILIVDSKTLQHRFVPLKLPQLYKRTVSSPDEIVPTDFDHTIYELEGVLGEHKNVEAEPLLAKKVVKRDYKSSLNFTTTMTLTQELEMYLKEVLKVPNYLEVLKEADDYISKAEME